MSPAAVARRGRPRSAEVEGRILEATLELAGETGINAMSMDDLAQRACTSKATIYRRWSSKEALVLDAMRHAIVPFDDIDTGSLGSDLRVYLHELGDRMSNGKSADVLPHLIEVSVRDESLRASLDDYVQHRRRPLTKIIQRGIDRGELTDSTDVEILVDALLGPFVYRRHLRHEPLDDDFVQRLLAVLLPGT